MDSSNLNFKRKLKLVVSHSDIPDSTYYPDENAKKGIPKIIIKKETDCVPTFLQNNLNMWINEPHVNLDLNVEDFPTDIFDEPNFLNSSDNFFSLFDGALSDLNCEKVDTKQEYISEEESSNSSKTVGTTKKHHHTDTSRKRKAVTKEESPVKEIIPVSKFTLMSPYEEDLVLQKLKNYSNEMKTNPQVRRLYRKLVVRKLKRERNLPIFDIDVEMRSLRGMDPPDYIKIENISKPDTQAPAPMKAVLDRFQNKFSAGKTQQYVSFVTRLMGLEGELSVIVSPQTERVLKPIIFRDYKTKPLKMRLLEEILSHANKNNKDWLPRKPASIDYCYVRPEFIPGINSLCHEFLAWY
ncbi:cysteine-rich protein 2-binding protein [Caerostris extrusa]|uniref:Cysteine-rich protein 2-binding protein n=1 Tax=Caerostris extrusa TaxID=172846 RepID=A0AAV4YG23_CAEEX|nr:cysteine-rich protein 2-binding protein [Caerostris extrusa]